MKKQAKRVAKNTGFLYARMAITVVISLYVTRLVLAALGADDFGTFMVVAGAISMLTFLNAAMAGASQRFMSYAQGEGEINRQKNIFNASVVLHFIIAILLVVILEVGGYFLFDGILKIPTDRIFSAKMIYQFMIVSTLFSVISVPYDAVINAHENMFLVAILGIFEAFLKLGIAFYITYTSFDKLISYGLLMALLSVLLLIIRRVYCHKVYNEVDINIKKYFDKPLFKEMTGFAGWSFLGSASGMISNYGQGIVLNMFFGTVVNAAQGVAVQINGQLSAFASTMLKALNPTLAKSEGAGNRALMLKATMMGSKISFFLLMIFFIPALIEMPYIFSIWLKEVPMYAVLFCQLSLVRSLIEQLFITLSGSIKAVGNIRKYEIFSSILGFFPLFVTYIMFNLGYAPYFVYIIFIMHALLSFFLALYFSKMNYNLNINLFMKNVVLRSSTSFIIVFFISLIPIFYMEEGLIRLITVLLLNTSSFFIVIWFVGFSSEEQADIQIISEDIIKKIKVSYKSRF